MTQILDGHKAASVVHDEVRSFLKPLPISPHLVVLHTHPHPASATYVRRKEQMCREVGIRSTRIEKACTTTQEIISLLEPWNTDEDVDGILVQFPLHPDVDFLQVIRKINPSKDVDGVHPENLGKLVHSDPSGFIPCTPLGIARLLEHYAIAVQGKHVVIVGRSVTVGKPLALLFSQNTSSKNATVTIAHRATRDLGAVCRSADIIVAAAGSPRLITASMVTEGSVVVDVGISRLQGSTHLVGDVDYDAVLPKVSAISPVPGGVGPMTVASLLSNTLKSFCIRRGLK